MNAIRRNALMRIVCTGWAGALLISSNVLKVNAIMLGRWRNNHVTVGQEKTQKIVAVDLWPFRGQVGRKKEKRCALKRTKWPPRCTRARARASPRSVTSRTGAEAIIISVRHDTNPRSAYWLNCCSFLLAELRSTLRPTHPQAHPQCAFCAQFSSFF